MKSLANRLARWFYRNLLWDATATLGPGWSRFLWATRKLSLAGMLAALLTWREWVEHHPPEIALIAGIHFVFVMIVLAFLIRGWQWVSRGFKKTPTSS